MVCKSELGNSTMRDDGVSGPLNPRQLHAAATPHHRQPPSHPCRLSRMGAFLPGSLLPGYGALVSSTPQHGPSGEWRRYFNNLRMRNPLWKSPKEVRTTFRINRNLLWIILVLICSVTWPLAAHGLTVEVDEVVRAPAGGQMTISCNYTVDKSGSGTNKNGMPAPLDVRWMRAFANGSSEVLLTKTASTIKGKWSEEGRATVVGQASLQIYAVSFRDDGKYTCKVGDAQGTTELFVDETPRILNITPELLINTKEALELTCTGADELLWEWPTHPQQSFMISSKRDAFSSRRMSILRIEQVSTEDTGEYQCVHSHRDSQDKWYSAPVYVFVTSTEEPLFLAPPQTNLVHFWDEPFLIPCRVSSPNATVSLTGDGVTSAPAATYDPRVGFTVDAELTDYSGNISCNAVLGDRTEVQSYMAEFVGRPQIITDTPEIVINRTSRLELVCTGVQPMHWITPDSGGSRLDIVETLSQSPNSDPMYRNVLTLYETQWLDTGEYGCQYTRYTTYDDPLLKSAIYVFVRSPDSSELFLPAADDVYIKNDSQPFIIPCRVSNPGVTDSVTLSIVYTVSSDPVPGLTWIEFYDPKVGFNVSVNLTNESRKLTVLCKAEDKFRSFRLYQEGKTDDESLFQTEIVPSARQLVQGTGPLKISCTVEMPFLRYSKWNNNWYPKNEFFFPNQQNEKEGNVEESGTMLTLHGLILRFTNNLTIHRVSLENNGIFYCNIQNEDTNLTISDSISVIESGYMTLSHHPADQDAIEAVEGEAEVCAEILMEAFPSATFWWSKDGVNLTNETHPEFSVTSLLHGEHVQVVSGCIQNLSLADGGFYTLTAANGYERRNLSVQIIILESPEVNLTVSPEPTFQDPPLFYTEQDNNITCHVWGNPLPKVAWYWQACRDDFCTEVDSLVDESGWVPIEEVRWQSRVDERVMSPNRKIESVLTIQDPRQAGTLRCLARSPSEKIEEPGFEDLVYRPSDLRMILPAAQQVKMVHTNDQTTLTCKANIFAFSDDLVWDWAPTAANASYSVELPGDDDRIKATEMTGYHYQSGLSIEGALRNNSGVYRCLARQRSNGERRVVHNVQLNVKDITPPTITAGLLSHYNLDRKRTLPIPFKMECQAAGDPIPSFAWYKDGRPITVRNATISDIQTFSRESYTVVSELFLMPDITEAHGGTYLCLASNSGGEVSSKGVIHIGESPTAVIEEDVVTRKVGKNLTVVCQTTGEPAPTITWMKEQRETGEKTAVPPDMYNNQKRALSFKELKQADNGKYFCIAENMYGEGTAEVTVILLSGDVDLLVPLLVGGICVGAIILILILCLLATFKRMRLLARKAKRNSRQDVEMFPVNPRSPRTPMSPFRMSFREEFADHLPFDSKWEFPRDRLQLGSLIGQGAFGMVLKGVAAGINQNDRYVPVAVKTVKSDSSYIDRKALLGELKMLIQVGHHLNVVNFLGACTQESSPLVIVEFCPYGNLCEYLRSKRDNFQKTPLKSEQEENEVNELNYADLVLREACVSEPAAVEYELVDKEAKRVAEKAVMVEDLVCYCFQVARGMEFLASRKCIHRDLAARNVLLAENNVVKICDFGLSRSIYHDADYIGSGKGLLPIKWMAPEAIFDKVFTTYSDIWSFGVFTWEVFSMGGSPYPGVQVDEKFYDKMKAGYRMSCPEHAPKEVYTLMLECWKDEPKDRPMFSELTEQFGNQLESNTRQEYIDLNIPYSEGMYCELDFAKSAAKQKPDTVSEELDTVQPNPADTKEDGNVRYQMSPTLKKESNDLTPTPPCQDPKQDQCAKSDFSEEAFPTNGYAAFHPAGEDTQQGPPLADRVQLPEFLPDHPYHRGTEQPHTYSSVKRPRPGLHSCENNESNSSEIPKSPDEGKLHTYASIKGTRPSPDDTDKAGFERSNLYSSIKGSRPGLTPNTTSKVKSDNQDATEGSSLLGKPQLPSRNLQSLDRSSDGKFRPALPKRDLSTTSWSPETETLLTGPESPELDAPVQPVYV